MLEKLNWFRLTSLITLVLWMWKWIGLFLWKNHLLRCWSWLSLLNWIGALTLSLLLKLHPNKSEPWFVLWSFFLLMLLCIFINLPCSHSWNTAPLPYCQERSTHYSDRLQYSVHWGINLLRNTAPSFLPSPIKSANCPSLPFLDNSPYILGLCAPLKFGFFSKLP